jgi:hypothetical protein
MDRTGSVDVVVSENGRSSTDGRGASGDNARTYYNQNLIANAGKGTRRKPWGDGGVRLRHVQSRQDAGLPH